MAAALLLNDFPEVTAYDADSDYS